MLVLLHMQEVLVVVELLPLPELVVLEQQWLILLLELTLLQEHDITASRAATAARVC